MAELTNEDRKNLLRKARSEILSRLGGSPEKEIHFGPAVKEKRGCFVTLHKKGALRGCIGTIEPVTPLISCVTENAVNSAFRDPRFPGVKLPELSDIDIEISVLTVPVVLEYEDGKDLIRKLKPGIHGVILSNGPHRSTFLPQVWEQLPDPVAFIEHLCRKGGMRADCPDDPDTVVQVYEAQYFGEKEFGSG